MIISMLATLCHMVTVSPGMPAVEFCQEQLVAQQDQDINPKDKVAIAGAINACYRAAQMEIARRIEPGFTLHEWRCTDGHDGKDTPKGSI